MSATFAEQPADILARLAELRAADAPTHGGHVLSYVYDSGLAELDELAAAAIRAVQPVNGLDPTTFTSVAVMEREVIAFARDLLGGAPDGLTPDVVGSVTTGGTESCLLAVKTARDNLAYPGRARLLAPVTVHAAFQKAAHYFGLELDLVPVGPDGRANAAAMIQRMGPDVALVVVSAPSYPHAALDPIAEVAAAAAERGIACHVDACIGGWVLPFWSGLPVWDFTVPGVTSISADLHKFGYAPKGISVLLQRGRPPARPVLHDHRLARLPRGQPHDARFQVRGRPCGRLGDHPRLGSPGVGGTRGVVRTVDLGARRPGRLDRGHSRGRPAGGAPHCGGS